MGRYEDILFVKPVFEAVQDEAGDWITPEGSDFVRVAYCRDEPNGSGSTISGTDGNKIVFSSVVQLPDDCPEILPGQEIRVVHESGTVILEGKALRFKRYRKNARLWV